MITILTILAIIVAVIVGLMLLAALPRLMRWYPLTVVETLCVLAGLEVIVLIIWGE